MAEIVRTLTRAEGGVTPEELDKMQEHVALWTARAFRTDPIVPDRIIPAIEGLYSAAGLKKPRVVIVPSPLVMAFAHGAAAAILYRKGPSLAGDDPAATRAATHAATVAATRAATVAATDAAEKGAAAACFEMAGMLGLECARRWWVAYQGGNMWPAWDSYLTAARDILGLRLPEHKAYEAWEQAAIEGGFRVLHPEFCMVSDFPEILRVDAENRPHCEDGPSHRWRDGWALYHWHGVRVPSHWIESRNSLPAAEVMAERNLEVRRAGIEMLGWNTILQQLGAREIDADADPEIGTLLEVKLPDVGRTRFVRVRCGTGREFAVCVPPEIDTALAGQAWMAGLTPMDFTRPEVRS
ncbi:DUF6745 domain-containing protein [Xanthobacter aminoxidans]|uniref:DUF6745 domain-containing protein n=1 Tax=Xanthobacter aminoxidans TaxID=186280 RepID=UPI003728489D